MTAGWVKAAGSLTRKRYTPGLFLFWFYLGMLATSTALIGGYMLFMAASIVAVSGEFFMVGFMLLVGIMYAVLLGGLLGAVLLPFLLLTFLNGLYRERFHAVFHLDGTASERVHGEA